MKGWLLIETLPTFPLANAIVRLVVTMSGSFLPRPRT